MAEHNRLGSRGEGIAVSHLQEKACTILEKNWRHGHLEVDIIARQGDQLVIAEVKTRHENFLGSPAEAVGRKKQELLIRAANAYIGRTGLNLDVRFDIIVVIFTGESKFRVHHIENAFYPVVRR